MQDLKCSVLNMEYFVMFTGGRSIAIDKTKFTIGVHRLKVFFIPGSAIRGPVGAIELTFTVRGM